MFPAVIDIGVIHSCKGDAEVFERLCAGQRFFAAGIIGDDSSVGGCEAAAQLLLILRTVMEDLHVPPFSAERRGKRFPQFAGNGERFGND